MRGDGNFAHRNEPEERRLSDTIAADNSITPAICECEGRPRTGATSAVRSGDGKRAACRIRFEPKETSMEGR